MVVCSKEGFTYVVSNTIYVVVEIEAFAISLHDQYTLKSMSLWSNTLKLQWKSCYRTIPVCGQGGEMMVCCLSSVVACPVVVLPCLETSVQVNLVFSWYTQTQLCTKHGQSVEMDMGLVLYLPYVQFLDVVMERVAMILPMESQLFKLCIGCTCLPANICVSSSKKIYCDNSCFLVYSDGMTWASV